MISVNDFVLCVNWVFSSFISLFNTLAQIHFIFPLMFLVVLISFVIISIIQVFRGGD